MGTKLLDASIDPEKVLEGTLIPQISAARPETMPLAVDWPDLFYREPGTPLPLHSEGAYFHELDLAVENPSKHGPLIFSLKSAERMASFELHLLEKDGGPNFEIRIADSENVESVNLDELAGFFEQHPPTFWFADGASLTGNLVVRLRSQPDPFPRERIDPWDWSGVDIRIEAQGMLKNSKSIQYRVIETLSNRDFTVLFDDDGPGEAADVVGVREGESEIALEFYHCKYSAQSTAGARIEDLYEVCGQAQKSVRRIEDSTDLFAHLLRREPKRKKALETSRFELGTVDDLLRIREKSRQVETKLKIFVVQPGMSREKASGSQLELLAVTENYLIETFRVPLGVIASE